MHNQAPIILNCFSRGGSNILWNMFLTHPDVCSPIWETLQIFSLNPRAPRVEGFVAAFLGLQPRLFSQWFLGSRKRVPNACKSYIDRTLYRWKLRTFTDPEMRYKHEGKVYKLDETENSRLCIKNNNGLTFLSDMFAEMYPDSSFIGLVRHPLALYESHKRRKTPVSKSIHSFCDYYTKMTNRMLADSKLFDHYHIIKFENILSDSISAIKLLYDWTDLDFYGIEKIRFRAKPHMQSDGRYESKLPAYRHYWFPFHEIESFLEPKVNHFQVSRLAESERCSVLERLQEQVVLLGYDAP